MINVLGIHQQPTMEENISNLTSASGEASVSNSSNNRNENSSNISQQPIKKKRSQPGHPDPGAEVIALSPKTLVTTNRFVCDVCNKGFQRDQNLQLHRRGHNLPWKLKQKSSKEVRRKVYICPEIGCVHHDPSRALGDLTGIKKHFYRKHGEKKWKCEKCSKKYAVQSDWKAHSKICGTREYRCDCGTLFSRRDSFITHRAFCDALAQENVRSMPRNCSGTGSTAVPLQYAQNPSLQTQLDIANGLPFPIKKEHQNFILKQEIPPWLSCSPIIGPGLGPPPHIDLTTTPSLIFQDFHQNQDHFTQNHDHNPNPNPSSSNLGPTTLPSYNHHHHHPPPPPHISATALLQRASQMGAKSSTQQQFPSPRGDSGIAFTRPYQADHVTVGFGRSSRDQLIHGLASYADKSAAMTGGGATGNDNNSSSNNNAASLVHQMMMMNNAGFDQGPGFDDMGFGQIMNVHPSSSKDHDHDHHHHRFHDQSENLTRDFLGLRPLSQNDILSITGLDSCINNNTNENQNQTPKSWQG
ncbi:hypothetical protein C2S52_001981 [Perilla frutescens var. hirtella]|nr:hypothetical protein C2S51_006588 [Perilla frutescens var. frutescens]KAH6801517.1 hypothetical protein C2S52_001981 [Perilla frutescens var. hirtella]